MGPPDLNNVNDDKFGEWLDLGVGSESHNLYLYGEFKDGDIKSYTVDYIVNIGNPVCKEVENGKIGFVLENTGSEVMIS